MEPNKTIKISSLNYYESKFPGRKLVNLEKLRLIKMLRQDGYEVIILPNDGKPFQYVFVKGILEILSDPIQAYIVNSTTGFFLGLLGNYLPKLFGKKEQPQVINNVTNLIIHQSGTNNAVDYTGTMIPDDVLQQAKSEINEKKINFEECFRQKSPFPTLPVPIFLNHQPEIIGWCRKSFNDVGMLIEDGIITNGAVRKDIDDGIYKGFSVAGIAEYSRCSICLENYVDCNHISGEIYSGKNCVNEITKSSEIEVSIVNEPTNSLCLLQLK